MYQIYCTKCRTPRPRKPRPSHLNVKKEHDDSTSGVATDDKLPADVEDQEMDDEDKDSKEVRSTEPKEGSQDLMEHDHLKKEQEDVKPEVKDASKQEFVGTTPSAPSGVPSRGRPGRRGRGRGRKTLTTPQRSQESQPTPMESTE